MWEYLDESLIEQIKLYSLEILIALVKVIAIYLVGRFIISHGLKAVQKAFEKWELEASLRDFLLRILRFVLYLTLILIVLQSLDVKIAALLGILGAAGLAIGLALQGSLANFAGGILILVFKPFRVADIIEAQGFLGRVERIDILHTHVQTFDNRVVVMPNGALANSNITNLTLKDTRRVEMSVSVAYGSDIEKVRSVILGVLAKDERVLPEPEPVVRFVKFGESSLDLTVRCWTIPDNLWPVYWENLEAINNAFVAEGIVVPFPQRTVHMRQS